MKKVVISLLVFFSLSSCTDLNDSLYDRIPSDNYPENDIQGALITVPVYEPMQELLDWGGWWFAQEVTSDEVVCPTRHTDWDDGGKWRALHTHEWDNTTEAVSAMWSRFYKGIVEANRLIETLEGSSDPATLSTIGKLKVMRAFYYYLLIDNYGDVPYVTAFSAAEEFPSKTPRAEVFAAIVADIEASIPNISESVTKTAVTKSMAYTLLAKLYLNAEIYTGTAQWAKAEEACDNVIASGAYSLEMNSLSPFVTQNELSLENIFTIPFDEDSYEGFNLHMRTLTYSSNLTYDMPVGPWNGFAAMEDHYNSYEDVDTRRAGFMVGQQYTSTGSEIVDETAGSKLIINPHIPALKMDATYTPEEIRMSGARAIKFEIAMGAKDNLSNDFPVFRYADVLLMKAEAMIRQGNSGDIYVNMVRSRAGVSNWTGTTLDQILEERGREMFWEAHRRQDLIRFGKFTSAWWEKSASSADRNTFPIPQWVLDSNPNL